MFDVLEWLEWLAKIILGDPEIAGRATLSQDHDMTINLRKTVDFLQSRDDR